jgi:fumarylpyruvate hydrolase
MSAYVIPPPPVVSIPTTEGGQFPVRRIFCVGRNYAAHAREMGHDPDREDPFFFSKPADAIVLCTDPKNPTRIPYPPATKNLHHELELVVGLKSGGSDITEADAMSHVWGYAVGLDMTRRDMQGEAKKAGRPWDMAKGFDDSAPIGLMVPASAVADPSKGLIELKVNGKVRQSSDLSFMIWSIPETIAYLSRLVRLEAGDLIMTGTPEGVAACVRGDVLEGAVTGVGTLKTKLV